MERTPPLEWAGGVAVWARVEGSEVGRKAAAKAGKVAVEGVKAVAGAVGRSEVGKGAVVKGRAVVVTAAGAAEKVVAG